MLRQTIVSPGNMPAVLRRLFTILCALSLVACIATVILCARSYQSYESIFCGKAGGRFWLFENFYGRLRVFIYLKCPQDEALQWRRGAPKEVLPAFLFADWSGLTVCWEFSIPHAVVAAGTGILPAIWTITRVRRRLILRRRMKRGLCLQCGYDLRASPARCPECGTAIVRNNAANPASDSSRSELP